MKNNYVKYGLILVVAVIWGRIIINYFGLFEGTDEQEYAPEVFIKPHKKMDTVRDYQLKLDYSDPFLSQHNTRNYTNPVQGSNTSSKSIPKKTIQVDKKEPTVTYKGLVKNKNSSKKTGLAIIDNRSYLVGINQVINSIKILNFNEKELSYSYGNKRITVAK